MKKCVSAVLCLLLALLLAACGAVGSDKTDTKPDEEPMKIGIDDVIYVSTGMAVPAEPDPSTVEYVEIPVGGEYPIEAFARIEDGGETYLLCLMNDEWIRFDAEQPEE